MSPLDVNVAPKYGVATWNETRWNGCWNDADGVGLYLHAGRYRHDLDLWWVQVAAYLPGGALIVDRFWGRNRADAGVAVGGLDLRIVEDGWTARFDGAGQLTTTGELARGPRGATAPFRRLRFEIEATAAASEWDMYAALRDKQGFAGDAHVQQGYRTRGTMTVGPDATAYSLDGVGFKDHSSGTRSFDGWQGHRFLQIVGEDYVCHAIGMLTPDGGSQTIGALVRGGKQSRLTRFELPPLADAAGGPVFGDVVIEAESGERLAFASELVHALPMTITMDNDNVNGVDWEIAPDPVVIIEGKARLTAPDGTVAVCFHERSALRSRLSAPSGPA